LSGTGRAAPARAPGAAPQPSPPCQVRAPAPEHVTLSCSSSTGGYAVLLDRVAPGWTAELDGRPARIERADLLARAVAVPPGDHEIRFRYRTPGLRLGGLVSLLAWLNLALAAIVIARRGRS
ncbi:MAG TPA: YfhO family protein, partial [Kofleriaceae bacterium]|nr:YfhO family protein [Kofleriaceae bacterium]